MMMMRDDDVLSHHLPIHSKVSNHQNEVLALLLLFCIPLVTDYR